MATSERVTWETCPSCGRFAAFAWRDGSLVAFDCPGGCRLPGGDVGRRAPTFCNFPPAGARRPTGADAQA
jgi:hypothetical protein